MYCLRIRDVYGWLATINPGKVAPEAREAVSRYRRECYDVLYDHFAGAAKRQQEQNRAEQDLLDRKAAALDSIANHKRKLLPRTTPKSKGRRTIIEAPVGTP